MLLRKISQRFHDLKRVRQILQVLVKYGFGYAVDRLNIEHHGLGKRIVNLKPIKRLRIQEMTVAVRLRKTMEELGPTFIKFGQILSTRPDMLPVEFCCELEVLQDNVAPISYADVKKQVEGDLKVPLETIFYQVDREPMAAASLAQVHRAKLKTGEAVIIKAQRPGIAQIIKTDIEIMEELARLAEKYIEEIRVYNPVGLVEEFKQSITRELDYSAEAHNIQRFHHQFAGDPTVYVPPVFMQFTGPHVLVMEQILGIKVSHTDKIDKEGLNRKKIAVNIANAFLKQVFAYGFFHADPHPGNIMVLPHNTIAFIDYGMTGRIHQETRRFLSEIMIAVTKRDAQKIADIFLAVGVLDEQIDMHRFELDLEDFLDRYLVESLQDLKMGQFLNSLLNVTSRYRIRAPQELYLLSKALVEIESVGEILDMDFDMVKLVKPFVQKLVLEKRSPKRIAREVRAFVEVLYDLALSLPKDLKIIFNKLKKGTLRVEFEHRGLENLLTELDKISNRISFSVVIAALIVGSSIIVQTDKGPHLFGLPVFGILGYVIAGFMGLWLAIAILRSGRL
ncbi:MAG TPA: AarF/UbiB family protein [bacterium]